MQRRQYQPYISRLNTFESPRSAYNRQSMPPLLQQQQPTSTIKQLIQINNPVHHHLNRSSHNNNNNRNYVIKYPVGEQSILNEHRCNCDENEYDEINSFNEEENYSEYDHLNLSTEPNHYLQPAYHQTKQMQINSSSTKEDDQYQNNYFHLDRKQLINNIITANQQPPPLPKTKLPNIQTKSYNELLNKSLTSSSSFEQILSPISSGYNSCQDILNITKQKPNDYYYYENNLSTRYPFMDSGFSTLSSSNRLSEDEEVSSDQSPYYSSPSSSSSFSSNNKIVLHSTQEDTEEQINMIQASPFPRVNTSLIAQIKQINSNKPKKLSPIQQTKPIQKQYKSQEPIYENLNKHQLLLATTNTQTPKQYSLNDVFNSLKSLDLNNPSTKKQNVKSTRNYNNTKIIDYTDKLCDKEVEFYLSPPNIHQYNEYEQHVKSNQFFHQKPRTNQFWEQLV